MSKPPQDQSPTLPAGVEEARDRLGDCLNAFGATFQAELRRHLGVLAATAEQALEAHKRLDEYGVARDTAAPDARPLTLVERLGLLLAQQVGDAAQVPVLQARVAELTRDISGLRSDRDALVEQRDDFAMRCGRSEVATSKATSERDTAQARVAELEHAREATARSLKSAMDNAERATTAKQAAESERDALQARVTALMREQEGVQTELGRLNEQVQRAGVVLDGFDLYPGSFLERVVGLANVARRTGADARAIAEQRDKAEGDLSDVASALDAAGVPALDDETQQAERVAVLVSERDALRAKVEELEKDRSEGRTAALSTIASAMGCPPESKGLMYFMGRAKALVAAESERDALRVQVIALGGALERAETQRQALRDWDALADWNSGFHGDALEHFSALGDALREGFAALATPLAKAQVAALQAQWVEETREEVEVAREDFRAMRHERDAALSQVEALKSAGHALQEVLGREPEDTEEYQDAVASARDAMTAALAGPPAAVRAAPDVMKPLLAWARVTLALRDADGDAPAVDRAVVLEVRGPEHVRVTIGQLRAALKSAGN